MKQHLILLHQRCDGCQGQVASEDNFCRTCGTVLSRGSAGPSNQPPPPSRQLSKPSQLAASPTISSPSANTPSRVSSARRLLENRAFVIFLLACVGPMGLPALWLSGRFSWNVKLITTGVYFLVVAVLPLVFAWYWLETAVRPLADILADS